MLIDSCIAVALPSTSIILSSVYLGTEVGANGKDISSKSVAEDLELFSVEPNAGTDGCGEGDATEIVFDDLAKEVEESRFVLLQRTEGDGSVLERLTSFKA